MICRLVGRVLVGAVVVSCLIGCGSGSNSAPPAPAAPIPPVLSAQPASPSAPPNQSLQPVVPPVGGSAVSSPPTQDNQAWTVCDVPSHGFAISIPPGWKQTSQSPQEFENLLKTVEATNPQLATILKTARSQIGANMKFTAIDLATAATGFATNVNVITEQLPFSLTLDQYVQASLQQVQQLPNVKLGPHKTVKTDAGDAEEMTLSITMRLPTGQSITTSTTQYAFIKGQAAYVVTLTTTPDRASACAANFEKVGKGFRFTK